LLAAIRSAVVLWEPGRFYSYSNFGFAALGLALEQMNGECYYRLAEDLTKRLGCLDLRPPLEGDRLVQGFCNGRPVEPWKMAAFAPAGGLTSTLDGLVAFAQANLDPQKHPELELAMNERVTVRMGVPWFSTTKRAYQTIGLGWHFAGPPEDPVVWHNGGVAGFRSYLGLRPVANTAVIVLAAHTKPAEELASQIVKPTV
jgi:CubicO group peptidase (beta-lactamase class C family)